MHEIPNKYAILLTWMILQCSVWDHPVSGFISSDVSTNRLRCQPSPSSKLFLFHKRTKKDNAVGKVISSKKSNQPGATLWYRIKIFLREKLTRYTIYVLKCEGGKYYVGSTLYRRRRYQNHFSGSGSAWTRMYKPIEVVEEYRRIPERFHLGEENRVTAKCMMKYGIENVRGGMFSRVRGYTMADLDVLTGFLGHYNQLNFRELEKQLSPSLLPVPRDRAFRQWLSSVVDTLYQDSVMRTPKGKQHTRPKSANCSRISNIQMMPSRTAIRKLRRRKSSQSLPIDSEDTGDYLQRSLAKADDKCFTCGEMGHWANNCPNRTNQSPAKADDRCYQCGEMGHRISECLQRTEPGWELSCLSPGGKYSGGKYFLPKISRDAGVVCYNCGKKGHRQQECLEDVICYNCGKKGHRASECPEDIICFKCGETGHRASECPSRLE